MVVLRYAPDGTRLWQAAFDNPNGLPARAVALTVSPAGETFVTGTTRGGDDWDVVTVKFDDSGRLVWEAAHAGRGARDDHPAGIALGPHGHPIVATSAGVSAASPCRECPDIVVLGLDAATGATRWRDRFDGALGHADTAVAMAVANGRVRVSGASVGSVRGWTGLGEPPRDIVTLGYGTR